MATANLVDVEHLTVEFATRNGVVQAVKDVSFTVGKGETVGIVGESGSGKSVTSYALMRILDANGVIAQGELSYSGVDIRRAMPSIMGDIRGREISMIFQNPRAALNPIRKIGRQIEDVLRQHGLATMYDAKEKAIAALDLVRIRNPQERYHSYAHELSGGMCQRVVIAIALACQPKLLIADEPTTGLDVTTQKAVLDLVVELTAERNMSTMLITHDLGLASAYCDRIVVMEKGRVVENAKVKALFARPGHAYTRKLIRATPRLGVSIRDLLPEDMTPTARPKGRAAPVSRARSPKAAKKKPLLTIRNLTKDFPLRAKGKGLRGLLPFGRETEQEAPVFRAVDDLSLDIACGDSVGLVGESGCGKSTTSSIIMRLLDPTSGTVEFDEIDIGSIPAKDFATSRYRPLLQMVFQDPTDSLNPRFTARQSIADPILRMGRPEEKASADTMTERLADQVGLPRGLLDRFPHQLSGGQKARVGIARAIALSPRLLVLDEPTAALDVSVQAVVLNLLQDLKTELNMSYLFVSHDLNVVRLLCDRVVVMRGGRIVEQGNAGKLMSKPSDAYTRSLLEAIPHPPAWNA
ncbi:MAG: dipeptide ABC transporter ATP-binding protein [Hyphomicrobiales bacterium]